MKTARILLVLIVIFSLASLSLSENAKKIVDRSHMIKRDGLLYEVGSDTPFTGTVVKYWPSGQKKLDAEYLDGDGHGKFIWWHANGKKWIEGDSKNGKLQGKVIWWRDNGQKKGEFEYHDGEKKNIQYWDEDGNPTLSPCE